MFIAGLNHQDRTRGTGWLDCPNCGEHAAQDVVDDMTFVQLFFYRFGAVARKRLLVCRRCGFRRPATADEMRKLQTGGEPIRRAVMVPMGVVGLGIVAGFVGLVFWIGQSSANALADEKIQLIKESGQAVPVTFDGPSAWNYDPSSDPVPSMRVSDSGGRMYFVIKRVTDGNTLEALLESHFNDEVGITTTGFPDKAPSPKETTVAGTNAIYVIIKYNTGAENDEQLIYVTSHNGVGYVLTYVALGDDAIKTMTDIAAAVNKSVKFTSSGETPPPAASPSPGESPSAAASPSPTH